MHCGSKEEKGRILSQLKIRTRAMISSPPIHAAQIVIEVLSDETLRKEWFHETKLMADRIKDMRTKSQELILTDRNTIEEGIGRGRV